jgi:dTDP-4-amino-4,6-dideoxygalactose transaminase
VTTYRIPFNRAFLTGREPELLAELDRSRHLSGDGPFTMRCQSLLEAELGVDRVLLTTSGTHALELAAILTDIRPGEEFVVPSFTFVSTVNAFLLRGATPVFVDIRSDTLNMDERLLGSAITERTRVIVPVHYGGVACDMDPIAAAAEAAGAVIVEDNALGLFGRYKDRPLGTLGVLGCQSFHETKSFSCGEGGALLVNDPDLVLRAEVVREKGTDRSQFFRGQVDKYTWRDIGSSYLPSDVLAALLWAQLEARATILQRRRQIWQRYHERLEPWVSERGAARPVVPEWCEPSPASYHLLLADEAARDALIARLRDRGILAVFHYLPLHLSPMGERLGGRPGQLPVTESVSRRLVRLPFYNDLSDDEQDEVIAAVTND